MPFHRVQLKWGMAVLITGKGKVPAAQFFAGVPFGFTG
jgi:hypothetical protein